MSSVIQALSNNPAVTSLPVWKVLDTLSLRLTEQSNVVLVAPPGAGKTTLLPLALLNAPWRNNRKIIMLEPRRLAARAAAQRMAALLNEPVGKTVGYRVRFDTKISDVTQLEVVTQGVFRRLLNDDPSLENVAAIVFDEFHERSLDGDLALALCLDLQSGLREDLRLLPMSATLDAARVAELLDATVVESAGRAFPVDISYLPRRPDQRIEPAAANAVLDTLRKIHSDERLDVGHGILVFLPGQAEIRRTHQLLSDKLPNNVSLHSLYAALPQSAQKDAIKPVDQSECRVILATSIAETSLTIDGVDWVIDSGLVRVPRYEPATGLTRLETVRASRAAIDQRAGRAGRTRAGHAVRLWHEQQTNALPKHSTPEILQADLSTLVLDCIDWGISDPHQLAWMDPPPLPAMQEARKLLARMDALTSTGSLTSHGRALRQLSLPPRLGHMVLKAADHGFDHARTAAMLSLLLQEPGVGGSSPDMQQRLDAVQAAPTGRESNIVRLAETTAKTAASMVEGRADDACSAGVMLAYAFPDRIAQRSGQAPDGNIRYRLANGRGAQIPATSSLADEPYLVIADASGPAGAATIRAACPISASDLERFFSDQMEWQTQTEFDETTGALHSIKQKKLGALSLSKPTRTSISGADFTHAVAEAVRQSGLDILPWQNADRALLSRLACLHENLGAPWPDVSADRLVASLEMWLMPFLAGLSRLKDLPVSALSDGLILLAGHPPPHQLEALVPQIFVAPSGTKTGIDYHTKPPGIALRPQELFGLDEHPHILNGALALNVTLLSPAGRPIQITNDLPGFWRGSWADVRADMRGRYPKHPWPEDPLTAAPTARAKPRK